MNHFFGRVNKRRSQRIAVITLITTFCLFVPILNQNIQIQAEQNYSLSALEQSGRKTVHATNGNERPGVIVLGMHRSGTSMLSGVLVEGFGYEAGGPLIEPRRFNEKVRLIFSPIYRQHLSHVFEIHSNRHSIWLVEISPLGLL